MKDDTISRAAALNCVYGTSPNKIKGRITELPPAQPTLYGYDLINLIIFADAVRKNEITESEIKDYVRNARAAWNYAWEEFLRVQKEALKQTLKNRGMWGQDE